MSYRNLAADPVFRGLFEPTGLIGKKIASLQREIMESEEMDRETFQTKRAEFRGMQSVQRYVQAAADEEHRKLEGDKRREESTTGSRVAQAIGLSGRRRMRGVTTGAA